VVTIGVFDGVHRGHRRVISLAVERARQRGVPAVVLTFDPNPAELLREGPRPARLTTDEQKARLLSELGVDVLCTVPFTREFSLLAPEEFARVVLVDDLHAELVLVGENFRFGHLAAGDVAALAALGRGFDFEVESVPVDGSYSSTYVRSVVGAGDVEAAARALGRNHELAGVVVRGAGRGRQLGFPTANIGVDPRAAVPADGVYAGWVRLAGHGQVEHGQVEHGQVEHGQVEHGPSGSDRSGLGQAERRLPAAISVGTNPTFDDAERTVEPYILDFDEDIYGETIVVEFAHRLRPMTRFTSVDDLVAQIGRDVAETRSLLAAAS